MFKCNTCGALFYEPEQKEEDPDFVPAPYGIGYVRMGGGLFNCCPECSSYDFEKTVWDGVHCPYCNEIIDLSCIVDDNNFETKCNACNEIITVKGGELWD